jgi:hypothetical protein
MGFIMKKLACLLILAATVSSTAWAACKPPDNLRKFPDGKTASKEEMQKAQQVFAEFDKKIEAYQACLKDELEAKKKKNPKADDALIKELTEPYDKKSTAALSAALQAKEDLNKEIQAYNQASRERKAAAAAAAK